jgi:DNA-binding MarR family transcriptional regulator
MSPETDVIGDFVKDRGYLTLGSRFKRLGERLQAEVQELARAEGVDLPAGLFPTIGALDRAGGLTIGELAEALGISQPGATRNVEKLAKRGLVQSVRRAADRRVKAVTLTDRGRTLVLATKHDLWPRVEQGVGEICDGLGGSLLEILADIERALDQKPLQVRAAKPRSDAHA